METKKQQFTLEYAGRTLTLEVGRMAEQATAAVIGRYGDSVVLATAVIGKERELHYFPLSVEYEERFYAAGKILGSRFMRREGRPSEEAVLSGRAVDRVIRPLFDHRSRREVQVVITILSLDPEEDLDFLALITASTALAISPIPWNGPVAGVKIAKIGDEIMVNPKNSALTDHVGYHAFVAGVPGKINMIELEGHEATEEEVGAGFIKAQKEIDTLIAFQNDIVKKIGKEKIALAVKEKNTALEETMKKFVGEQLEAAIYVQNKAEREAALATLETELLAHLESQNFSEEDRKEALEIMEGWTDEIVHKNILQNNKRPDLRALDEVRPLSSEVALLPRAHGSALFIRGNTQALAVATIAPPGNAQTIETISFSGERRFMLHYNFPPYSVGEVGFFRGPGRREIGHGALAEKALRNLIPKKEEFPYALRVVSEILSSNGSSSMATVCAASLALMDAGVPLKKPAAGIAMGLMSDASGNYKILTDIQGYEDHYGDADFKVAGTSDGVTAIQMDVKVDGLTTHMLADGLAQAKKARLQILKTIEQTLPAPRKELSPLAPLIKSLKINPSQIGLVIGPGGKTINGIIERTGALSIDIDDDGMVYIAGNDRASTEAAYQEVASLTKEYAVGDIVEGTVVRVMDFGAIVEFDANHDGMIHVSELKDGFVKNVSDVVKVGDKLRAKIIKVENGKIGLSLKQLKEEK